MAWVEYEKVQKERAALHQLRISCARLRTAFECRLLVSAELAGSLGLARGDRVRLRRGDVGPEAGQGQLIKDPDGVLIAGASGGGNRNGLCVRFQAAFLGASEQYPQVALRHRVEGPGVLSFVLPKWAGKNGVKP